MSDFSSIVSRSKKNAAKKPRKEKRITKKVRSIKAIERELWELCRQITFKRSDGNNCYTCSQTNISGMNKQCGHYFPKGALGALYKYDIAILRTQCFQCNINHGGMGGTFREHMRQEIGLEKEQRLFEECSASKGKPIKARDHYIFLIEKYRKILAI